MSDEPNERDMDMVAEAVADRVTWGDGTEYINVADAACLITQARREGAAEVDARAEALAAEWDQRPGIGDYITLTEAADELRAALRGDA